MSTPALRTAEISVEAIKHNVRFIRERTGGHVIIVVKANGYGHGAETVARAALDAGATMLGVADLSEGYALRDAGITAPLLCWIHGPDTDMDEVLERDISLAISYRPQLERFAEAAQRAGRTAEIQLKIDTGLSRNGASPDEWEDLFTRAKTLQDDGLIRVKGIFSHLSNAGDEEDLLQQEQFERALGMLREAGIEPEMVHMASSAATITSPHLYYNTVRVGLLTYGLSPFDGVSPVELGLKPAMTLKAQILAVRNSKEGVGVSYSYIYRCEADTRLALVPVGYADGFRRSLSGAGAEALVRGVRCPIVGRVSMDQFLVNLAPLGEDAASIGIGEEATIFGDPREGCMSMDELAALAGTISYEISVGIGPRVERVVV